MESTRTRFINGDEAIQHFMAMSKHDMGRYRHRSILKVWPGQFLGVYCYEKGAINPTIRGKLRVVDIGSDSKSGSEVKIINMMTGQMMNIGHIPTTVSGHDVGVAVPPRPYFERTIKEMPNGSLSYGTCTGLMLFHLNNLSWKTEGQDCVENWMYLPDKFTDEGAWERELARFMKEVRF